jgi:hypothetical protein
VNAQIGQFGAATGMYLGGLIAEQHSGYRVQAPRRLWPSLLPSHGRFAPRQLIPPAGSDGLISKHPGVGQQRG